MTDYVRIEFDNHVEWAVRENLSPSEFLAYSMQVVNSLARKYGLGWHQVLERICHEVSDSD